MGGKATRGAARREGLGPHPVRALFTAAGLAVLWPAEAGMTARAVPNRARTLARELTGRFTRDRDLAIAQNGALQRLRDANDRLWSGLAPDGLEEIYGGHPEFEAVSLEAAFHSRSEVLESADPLAGVQEVHWEIHRAMIDYQNATEDRRHLASEIGEAIARFVDALIDAGWTREDAERANVDELAAGDDHG